MKMEFERISEELIKPSSPTPTHLKTYKFSLIDQLMPSVYTPFILFYPSNDHNNSPLLKKSLSETLSLFYPLAGKVKNALSIDCTDEGVYYSNARVTNISLFDFLNPPNIKSLSKLLPQVSSLNEGGNLGSHVSMIRETCFSCGGIAIGLLCFHKAMDGISMVSFLKSWAEICSGKITSSTLSFVNASTMFPPVDDFTTLNFSRVIQPFLKKGRVGIRRFVFEAASIDRLKAKAVSSSVKNPTRVEVVSSLLCRRLKATRKAKSIAITYPMNFRRIINPPLPDLSMGNLVWFMRMKTDKTELKDFVSQMREAFQGVANELVKRISKGCDEEFFKFVVEQYREIGESDETDFIACTSWVNFGAYEIDFGWGKPVWISITNQESENDCEIPCINVINLMDAKMGKGIEGYVASMEEDLCILENDEEILSYATLNPNPLIS